MKRAMCFAVLLFGISGLSFAQRSGYTGPPAGRQEAIGRTPRPEDTMVELVVDVVYPNGRPAGRHIDVRVESAGGGTVAEGFTDEEGRASFGIRVGSYIIRIRGGEIKDTATRIINIESFEKRHMEYIQAELADMGGTSGSPGVVSVTGLKVPDKARVEFEKGTEAMGKGDKEKAIEHFEKAVAEYPEFMMAYNNLAGLYMRSSDVARAQQALDKALKADPDSSWTIANVVRLKLMQKKYAEAIPLLEKILAKEPENPEFLLLMCKTQYLYQRYDDVVIYARRTYAVPHQNFELAHILAGRALEAQNRPEEAGAEYKALLRESPEATEAVEARSSVARLENEAKKQ